MIFGSPLPLAPPGVRQRSTRLNESDIATGPGTLLRGEPILDRTPAGYEPSRIIEQEADAEAPAEEVQPEMVIVRQAVARSAVW